MINVNNISILIIVVDINTQRSVFVIVKLVFYIEAVTWLQITLLRNLSSSTDQKDIIFGQVGCVNNTFDQKSIPGIFENTNRIKAVYVQQVRETSKCPFWGFFYLLAINNSYTIGILKNAWPTFLVKSLWKQLTCLKWLLFNRLKKKHSATM